MPHSAASHAAAAAAPPSLQLAGYTRPDSADFFGQLYRPAGCLPEPERDRRRRALRVHDADDARLDAADPPRCRAEQEHVAGHALDRPVLVDGADDGVIRLREDPVVAELRDRTAGGESRDPGTAPATQLPVHLVPVQVRRPAAAAGTDPLGHQLGDLSEVLGRYGREWRRPAHQGQQVVGSPVRGRALGHHLLGQDVQRAGRYAQPVEAARSGTAQQRGAFHQLIPRGRIQQPGWNPVPGVIGPSDPLQERREAAR